MRNARTASMFIVLTIAGVVAAMGALSKQSPAPADRAVPEERDLGLDAVHLWPSGEIWFSTEVGFQSQTLGMISHGDLLSTRDVLTDRGSIIFKNLPLLATFTPLEKLANFGLDALFLVVEEPRAHPSVRETTIIVDEGSGDV